MSTFKSFLMSTAIVILSMVCAMQADGQFSKDVMRPSRWEKINFRAAQECILGLQECSSAFLRDAGFEIGERPIYEFFTLGNFRGRDLTVVFVTVEVSDDDSVSGIRYRLVLSLDCGEKDTLKLSSMGKQYTCLRGHKEWGKARCH